MIDFEITKVGGMATSNSQPVLDRTVSHSTSSHNNQAGGTPRGYVERLKAQQAESSTRINNCTVLDVKKPSSQTFVNSKSQESNESNSLITENNLLKEKNGLISSLNKTLTEKLEETPAKIRDIKLINHDNKIKTEKINCINSDTKELEKVLENVNKDLSITKEWQLKNSKQRTCDDPLTERTEQTVLSNEENNKETSKHSSDIIMKNTNTSSNNSSNSAMHLKNCLPCKISVISERTTKLQKSPLPQSNDELDDMSIDLTEEEEEELLGKNDPLDMDTDLDLQVDVGTVNQIEENETKEIDISQQDWQIVDEVIASSPEEPLNESNNLSPADAESSLSEKNNTKNKSEALDVDAESFSSQDTQLAPEDSAADSKSSSPTLSQGSTNEEKSLSEVRDTLTSNETINKVQQNDQGNLCTIEDVNLSPVPDEDPEREPILWNFKKDSSKPHSDILKEIQFFDNSAKEEGLQKEVDRVVQKILTDIPPEGDSDDPAPVEDAKNVTQTSMSPVLKPLSDKQIFEAEMLSEKWTSPNQNSNLKNAGSVGSQLCDNDSNKLAKRDLLRIQNQDENVKPDPDSQKFTTAAPLKALAPAEMETKPDVELKRKWKINADEGKSSDLTGLTVKKVKLDTEQFKTKPEPVARKLSQSELEDIIARRMSLYLTENERSEIGNLKLKCEHLEKSLEIWKRRANLAQKQNVELQISLQRIAQSVRKTGTAPIIKLTTRSVGLQVQMHSFLVPEGKMPQRSGPITNGNSTIKMIPAASSTGQPVLVNKNSTAGPLAMVNVGKSSSGSTSTLQTILSKPPKMTIPSTMTPISISPIGRPILPNTTTATSIHTVNTMTTKAANNTSVTKTSGTHAGVSILQPRITNSQPATNTLVMNAVTSTSPATGAIPKVANVVTPAPPTVRTLLDSRRIQATMSPTGQPVPMRLVPNQAVKQAGINIRPAAVCPSSTSSSPSPSTSTPSSSCATQATVKIIDLTADEDENNTSITQLQASGITSSNPSLTVQSPITTQVIPVSSQKSVAILATPITQTSTVSSGQIIINPSPSKNSSTLPVSAGSVRVPLAPALSQPMGPRLTYLVPASVRPVYVTNQPRQIQTVPPPNIMRPPIQTLLLQKGTTLVPVPTQASLTSVSSTIPQAQVRMTSPTVGLRGVTSVAPTFTTPSVPIVTRPPPPLQAMPRPALSSPANRMPASTSAPNTTTASNPSGTETAAGQAIVVSRVTHKHPAPLPSSTNVIENASNMRALPPKPALKISKVNNGIVLSWNMSLNAIHSEISSYQLYAYQESNAPPSTSLWKKVGDVKALPLPMACTLTQFMEGHKYHFAVRAVDLHNRIGPFSDPGSIVLNNSTHTGIRV